MAVSRREAYLTRLVLVGRERSMMIGYGGDRADVTYHAGRRDALVDPFCK
jgi:hypothetical protein